MSHNSRCIAFPLQCSTCLIKDDIVQHVCSVWTDIRGGGVVSVPGNAQLWMLLYRDNDECDHSVSSAFTWTLPQALVTLHASKMALLLSVLFGGASTWLCEEKTLRLLFSGRPQQHEDWLINWKKNNNKKTSTEQISRCSLYSKFRFWYGHNKYL